MLNYINPIKILVLLSFLHAVWRLDKNNLRQRYLLAILLLCLCTEVVNSILYLTDCPNRLAMSISVILHNGLWLFFLRSNATDQKAFTISIGIFAFAAIVNLLLVEGIGAFCYYTFVVGGFLYTALFLAENFEQLKHENVDYFTSNIYLLSFAPVLFLVGLSLMFGFDSRAVTSYRLIGQIKLYDFMIYFVNIIYYTLINVYIHRERRNLWTVSQ